MRPFVAPTPGSFSVASYGNHPDSVSKRRAAGKDLGGRRQQFSDSQIYNARRLIEAGDRQPTWLGTWACPEATLYRRMTELDARSRMPNAESRSGHRSLQSARRWVAVCSQSFPTADACSCSGLIESLFSGARDIARNTSSASSRASPGPRRRKLIRRLLLIHCVSSSSCTSEIPGCADFPLQTAGYPISDAKVRLSVDPEVGSRWCFARFLKLVALPTYNRFPLSRGDRLDGQLKGPGNGPLRNHWYRPASEGVSPQASLALRDSVHMPI